MDFDTVVASSGPPISRADFETFKRKIDTAVSRATGLVKSGVHEAQLMARLDTSDLGWQLDFAGTDLDRFYS